MGVLDEVSLHAVLERNGEKGRSISPALCARLTIECCEALVRAPDPRGPRVARVVTPKTFVLSNDGYVRLLVKYWDAYDPGMGFRFMYLSPEEAKGLERDERSQVFTLGAILWEMLAGGGVSSTVQPTIGP
ncbi:MAG: hypothetical protein M3619_15055 [Myxococcota bacterium]|nr:hypothetical protein [Myxococcota bacterium]